MENINSIISMVKNLQFETDLFETNIINLTIVIFIVVFFVGNILRSLLLQRQEKILKNIEKTRNMLEESKIGYENVEKKLEESIRRIEEIESKTRELLEEQDRKYQNKISNDIENLENTKESSIDRQKREFNLILSQEVIDRIIYKTDKIFEKSLNEHKKAQKKLNEQSIESIEIIESNEEDDDDDIMNNDIMNN